MSKFLIGIEIRSMSIFVFESGYLLGKADQSIKRTFRSVENMNTTCAFLTCAGKSDKSEM